MISNTSHVGWVSWRALSTLVDGWLTVHVAPRVRLIRCDPTCKETHRFRCNNEVLLEVIYLGKSTPQTLLFLS